MACLELADLVQPPTQLYRYASTTGSVIQAGLTFVLVVGPKGCL
jgi:hypothetical protein